MPIYLYHQPRYEPLTLTQVNIRNQGELRFYDNGNYVGFEAPSLSADQIWVLPTADGTNGQVLTTNGSGTLSWAASGAGSDVKAAIDSVATADYVGAAFNDGFLRVTQNELTYTDGGDFITLGLANHATARAALGLAIGTDVQAYDADLTTYAGITPSANVQTLLGAVDYAAFKTSLSLNLVENTALSTWVGTSNITTVGTLSAGDVTAQVSVSSLTVAGKIEVATAAETDTGTDATRAVSPDGLAGSIHGTKVVVLKVMANDTALTTGDGKMYFTVPIELNGMNLVSVGAHVYTVSSSGTPTVQIHNLTDAADMLSTLITIDANEKDSSTAATPAVINGAADDVVTGDELRVDVDVAGTGAKGLEVRLGFQIP